MAIKRGRQRRKGLNRHRRVRHDLVRQHSEECWCANPLFFKFNAVGLERWPAIPGSWFLDLVPRAGRMLGCSRQASKLDRCNRKTKVQGAGDRPLLGKGTLSFSGTFTVFLRAANPLCLRWFAQSRHIESDEISRGREEALRRLLLASVYTMQYYSRITFVS